jgi:hypothetical protein
LQLLQLLIATVAVAFKVAVGASGVYTTVAVIVALLQLQQRLL